jgi:RNA polymerase sigma-70 factor, ECF subfamily
MRQTPLPESDEGGLVTQARGGDRDAFAALVAPHRRALHMHCYRILGSLQEAEDLLQESLLRAWLALEQFEHRSSVRAWLYRIATNACLDALKRRKRRVLPDRYVPPDDPTAAPAPPVDDVAWIEPYPDHLLPSEDRDPAQRYEAREAIRLAFIAAIQFLSARERAVLILRDALGFSARETAAILDTSLASVNSALARARAALGRDGVIAEVRAGVPDPNGEAALVSRYMRAWDAADVDALVAVLREDARMTMPPTPSWYAGRAAIGAFFATFLASELGVGSRLISTRANRQPAFAVYGRASRDVYEPVGIQVLTLDEAGRITGITGFTDEALFPFFDLSPVPDFDLPLGANG